MRTPVDNATHFGESLRKIRIGYGMTLDKLATHSGISKGHLSDIENGKCIPGINVALKLSSIFLISIERMMHGGDYVDEMLDFLSKNDDRPA